jgi:hypothetical protein
MALGMTGARGQQPTTMPAIGVLSSATQEGFRVYLAAFRAGLREGGFEVGRNIRIEYRWAEGQYSRLPALAADLVASGVKAIFTNGGNPPALAAKAATTTIPIVFVSGGDPVASGLVANLGRPGGNVTGVTWISSAMQPKRFDLLRQAVGNGALLPRPRRPSGRAADQLRIRDQPQGGQGARTGDDARPSGFGQRGDRVGQPTFLRLSAAVLPVRRSVTRSNSTFWPSFRVPRPARSTALIWTKASLPPPSG